MQTFVVIAILALIIAPAVRRAFAVIGRSHDQSLAWYEIDRLGQTGRDAADELCVRASRLALWSSVMLAATFIVSSAFCFVSAAKGGLHVGIGVALIVGGIAFSIATRSAERASKARLTEFEALTGLDVADSANRVETLSRGGRLAA